MVGIRVTLILGAGAFGIEKYVETHTPMTNENGLISFQVGDGTPVIGAMEDVEWHSGAHQIKTQVDPEGGTNYTIFTTSQLVTVPYAFHAETAESLSAPTYEIGDYAQGGVVFYVDETGQHGLVCHMQNIAGSWAPNGCTLPDPTDVTNPPIVYGPVSTGAMGDGLYAGQSNTDLISSLSISMEGMTCGSCVARTCNQMQGNSGGVVYGDWYLPSPSELLMMYDQSNSIQITLTEHGGDDILDWYWSSLEESPTEAKIVSMVSGNVSDILKPIIENARPIRRF
jgi:hypothetical protein